jgi:apolipoprotein N-acyltransferase
VPQRVITAASIIAAQLFKRRRENPSFIITSEAAVVILRNDPQLNALLKGLNRPKVVEG